MAKTWEDLIKEFEEDGYKPEDVIKAVRGYEIISSIIKNLDELNK